MPVLLPLCLLLAVVFMMMLVVLMVVVTVLLLLRLPSIELRNPARRLLCQAQAEALSVQDLSHRNAAMGGAQHLGGNTKGGGAER